MLSRKLSIIVTLAFALFAAHRTLPATREDLSKLFEKRQYFELREQLANLRGDSDRSTVFYRAVVENKFNRPERSIRLLESYLRSPEKNAERKMIVEAYSLLADNYVKTFRYARAAATYDLILTKFADSLSDRERAGYQNVRGLWKAVAAVPRQTAEVQGGSSIQANQEPVGLYVPLEVNGQKESFIFDTGANISTIIQSHAEKLALDIYESDVEVGSISGRACGRMT